MELWNRGTRWTKKILSTEANSNKQHLYVLTGEEQKALTVDVFYFENLKPVKFELNHHIEEKE